MNSIDADNIYSQQSKEHGDDECDDGIQKGDTAGAMTESSSSHHRSPSHKKSKKKKKSSRRSDEHGERHSSSRNSADDEDGNGGAENRERKRKKKSKRRESSVGHVDGSLSPGSPGEAQYSLSSRKSRDSDKEKKSRKEGTEEDDRKPSANPGHRSFRESTRLGQEAGGHYRDSDNKKPKSKPFNSDKRHKPTTTDPVASRASTSSTLGAELETQMASKRRPTGPRPTRPGAISSYDASNRSETSNHVTSSTVTNLSQFEQDVQAKNRARRSTKHATTPGIVPVQNSLRTTSEPHASVALNRLEEDAMAKSRATRSGGGAVVAATGGNQHGKSSGRSSRVSASRRATAAAAAGASFYAPQPTSSSSSATSSARRASLLALEQELAAKSRYSSNMANSTVVEPGARHLPARSSTTSAAVSTIDGMAAAGGALGVAVAASSQPSDMMHADAQQNGEALANNRMRSADEPIEPLAVNHVDRNDYIDSFTWEEAGPQSANQGDFTANMPSSSRENGDMENAASTTVVTAAAGASSVEAETYPGVDFGSRDFVTEGAVEAFVADNVVDATGVAVVMSEEEEQQIEKAKYKKYLICALLCMVIIAVAIVVPVVLVVGEANPVAPSAAPSDAPSMVPSSSPTSLRLDDIILSLTGISSEQSLQDRSSPQYKAAQWVAEDDPLSLPTGDPQLIQRYVLAVFYYSTNGDDWLHCSRTDPICGGDPDEDSWLSGSSECIWLANRCVDGVNVDRIFFARTFGNNLNGTLASEIVQLSRLESLILQNNKIQGTIPEFLGEISLLNTLILTGNPMVGTIPEIVLETSPLLGTIHLSNMKLNGTISTEFATLPVTDLRLDENSLTGQIPSTFGSLAGLRTLELQFNMLSGIVPANLFSLPNVVTLRVGDNALRGSIPTTISQMVELEELWVNATSIGGILPEALYTLVKLTNLNLASAEFSGTLSESVAALSLLRFLQIQDNGFSGPVPAGLDSLTQLNEMLLHGNDLVGSISSQLCSRKGSNFFDLQVVTAPPQVSCPQDCCDDPSELA